MRKKILKICMLLAVMLFIQMPVKAEDTTWNYKTIEATSENDCQVGTEITVSPVIEGDTSGFTYKYVWMKNNWKEWAVIKDFSDADSIQWKPESSGTYYLYVDVKDANGKVVSNRIEVIVSSAKYQFGGISTHLDSVQKIGTEIELIAETSGNNGSLQYKFVWMKDNWKDWAVLKDFDANAATVWSPKSAGTYKIYVDVKDSEGNKSTFTRDFVIEDTEWSFDSITTDKESPQEMKDAPIKITANTSGESKLQYKFLWMKNGWKEWAVISDFSESNECSWTPEGEGDYTIYVDVKAENGKVVTKTISYKIERSEWKIEEVRVGDSAYLPVGKEINIETMVSGDAEGLLFKYVWMRDNWTNWAVLRDFGENETLSWTPEEAGSYSLYIDIKSKSGVKYDSYIVKFDVYEYQGVGFGSNNISLGESVEIYPLIAGKLEGAEFKFVWAEIGWTNWGVIQDFSTADSVTWTAEKEGIYNIYIDMKVAGCSTVTKVGQIRVDNIASKIKEIQENYINVPYKWGGSSPSTGWDCSGFTQWALSYLGVSIPRTAASQAQGGTAIDPLDMSQWQPGDVICYYNTTTGKIGHAALYLGDGKLMHALNNRTGTMIHDVDYYERIDKETYRVTVRRYL